MYYIIRSQMKAAKSVTHVGVPPNERSPHEGWLAGVDSGWLGWTPAENSSARIVLIIC